MICCYLMYSQKYIKAYDALRYYAMRRTKNKKVSIRHKLDYLFKLYNFNALQ